MSTKSTSTKASFSTRSTTTRPASRRISKLALFRVKVATVVLSMVLFFGSLTGIALYNPAVGDKAAAPVQTQQITIVTERSSDLLVLPARPPAAVLRPFVRSRGS